MLPIFLFSLARNLAASGPELRLAPWASRQIFASAMALPLLPAIALIVLAVRWGWQRLAGWSLIGVLLLGLLGGGALLTTTSPDFIFAPKYVATQSSPDGKRVAHLFEARFFGCTLEAHVGAPGDAIVPLGARGSCGDPVPALTWLEDGGVAFYGRTEP
jgi:hypothetical protein